MDSKIESFFKLPLNVLEMICTYFPGQIGFSFRYSYFKKKLRFLGKNVRIGVGVYFQNPEYITIDDNAWIDRHVIILAGPPNFSRTTFVKKNPDFNDDIGNVYIGKFTHIAPNCVLSGIGGLYIGKNCGVASNSTIYSFSHHYKNLADEKDQSQYSFTPQPRFDQQSMILGPVVIEDFCAVGLSSSILPGTLLGKGAWVACGTVVSGRFPPQTLITSNLKLIQKSLSNLKIRI